jgi:mannose-6-phosphate isomerase-like protein (cupin superfamily)
MDGNMEMLLNPGEGDSFWVLGDLYTFKVTGKQTNGAFTVMDQVIQPQSGPPPHIHHREDEAFYVLAGRFSFLCGDKQSVFEAGSFVYVPKGTLHTFKNIDAQQGRLLVTITPAGLEDFFYRIGTPAADLATPPAFDPAVIDKLMQLAKDYQMDIRLPEMK